jgi:hypothetical protein
MKKFILLIALFSGFSFVYAQGKNNSALGLWLQGGNSGEYWGFDYKHLGSMAATDIYLHISASDGNFSLGLYGGYYFLNNAIKADASIGKFPIHYGPNIGLGYWNDGAGNQNNFNGYAFRIGAVGGISWILPISLPMDISVELNPVAEMHYTSWKNQFGNKDNDTSWEIPSLYLRLMFHAYLF